MNDDVRPHRSDRLGQRPGIEHTSTTTGVMPSASSIRIFARVRVVPATSCFTSRSRAANRRPMTPVAPARKILIVAPW
jgi:hypothetical protein